MNAAQAIDCSAVPVPPPWADGLTALVARTLSSASRKEDATALVTALFGADRPTFGQLQRLTEGQLQAACAAANVDSTSLPVARLRELTELVRCITPSTPLCDSCGNAPLSNNGGKIVSLDAGSKCPFCDDGHVRLLRMRLRKVAWTDGRLVEPQTSHDLRSMPGSSLPLGDDDIAAWAGTLDRGLERLLKEERVPLYGWLAHMHLAEQVIGSPLEAPALLASPRDYGLATEEALHASVIAAGKYLAAREITNTPKRSLFPFIKADPTDLPRLTVGGKRYVLEGRVASGDNAEVYRGARDTPLTERVIIKACRGDVDEAKRVAREVSILSRLSASKANGTPFFARLIPEVVLHGAYTASDGVERAATVFRYKNGFDWTLADVIREYPEGVEPQTMVWMMNRSVMLLRWLQLAKLVHGALTPEHILIHPAYHGATFLSWSEAQWSTDFQTDVSMLSRTMIAVLGGDPETGELPASVPEPIGAFLVAHAFYDDNPPTKRYVNAETLEKEFGKVAESVYGPRKYHEFHLPRRGK